MQTTCSELPKKTEEQALRKVEILVAANNRKIDIKKYSKIFFVLDISPHLVAKIDAKQILETSSECEQEFYKSREIPQEWFPTQKKDYEETSDETTDKNETSQKKWSFFS